MLLTAMLPAMAQRLAVTKDNIDCGRTGYEMPVTATFELRNKSIRKLIIETVKPDCGCTSVNYPKEEIGAGDKFTVKLTYDARQLGHFHKMAAVMIKGAKEPTYLTMTGVVVTDMKDYSGSYPYSMGNLLLDKTDLEFDDVNRGDQPVQEIHILNNSSKAMYPNVMHLPPYLAAKVEPERVNPGRAATVTVTLNSAKLHDYGLTQTSVYMAREIGEKVNSEIEMGVTAVLLPDLHSFDPNLVPEMQMSATEADLADNDGKAKKKSEITLSNTGHATLKISALQMFTSGLTVTLGKRQLEPGETTKLKITGNMQTLSKARTKPRILMITNDPKRAKVVIEVKTSK